VKECGRKEGGMEVQKSGCMSDGKWLETVLSCVEKCYVYAVSVGTSFELS